MTIPKPTCQLCGAVVGDTLTHERWHAGQQEIIDYLRKLGDAVWWSHPDDTPDTTE